MDDASIGSEYAAGSSTRALAARHGVSQFKIWTALRRLGVAMRSQGHPAGPLPGAAYGEGTTAAEIASAYAAGGTTRALAERFGVTRKTVAKVVRGLGGATRDGGRPRTCACDASYFDAIDSESKAYWLGFLMADGCVTDRGTLLVTLHRRDAGHVHKLRAALRADYRITEVEQPHAAHGATSAARIAISNSTLCAGLARHGVVPRKSKTATPPKLPATLMRHFWRGAFDGDGALMCERRGRTNEPRLTFCGSRAMVDGFARFAFGITGSAARAYPSRGIYYYAVTRRNGLALATVLYGGATVSLDRKREAYERIVAHYAR